MPAKAKKRARPQAKQETEASYSKVAKARRQETAAQGTAVAVQLDEIISVVSSLKGLPPFVAKILGQMLPKALEEPENFRHRHQHRVIEMVNSSLAKEVDSLQCEIDKTNADLKDANEHLSVLKSHVSAKNELLAQKTEIYQQLHGRCEEARLVMARNQEELEAARVDRQRYEEKLQEANKDKECIEQLLEVAVRPWKDFTLQAGCGFEWSQQLPRLGQKLDVDSAVIAAAKSVLSKEAGATRSSFDGIAIDELESRMTVALKTLDAQISSDTCAQAESELNVVSATETHKDARQAYELTVERLSPADLARKAAEEELGIAQQSETQFYPELARRSSAAEKAQDSLLRFEQGPIQLFNTLRQRVKPLAD